MKIDQSKTIRIYILLIAIIGGLGFFAYLVANVYMANQNERHLNELLYQQHPVIEQIRELKRELRLARDMMNSAVGLEDLFLLQDSEKVAEQFHRDAKQLAELDPALKPFVHVLDKSFHGFYSNAYELVAQLIEDPGKLSEVAVSDSHQRFNGIVQLLDTQLSRRQFEFNTLLRRTNKEVTRANFMGAVMGCVVIVGLLLLAWAVSRKVLVLISETNRLKEEFLATISHELRTPMNGIVGALSLLSRSGLEHSQKSWMSVANRSAENMMMSIDDLLVFSEVVSGRKDLMHSDFQLKPEVEALIKSFEVDSRAKGLQVRLVYELDDKQFIRNDKKKVLQIVRHMLSNAIKFTPQGDVLIRVSGESGFIKVAVLDSGPGIPEAELNELFNPFQQKDGSFSRQFQGMGIGLSLCRSLSDILLGRFWLSNPTSGGLLAEFQFPLFGPVCADDRQKSVESTCDPVGPNEGRQPLVLVVEDNQINQMVLKGYLSKLGCAVVTADNGQEAVDVLLHKSVDMVFMDCQMPVMDGFQATKKIRAMDESWKNLPIVAVTANAMDVDCQMCLRSGMDGYLKKPVSLAMIESELRQRIPVAL